MAATSTNYALNLIGGGSDGLYPPDEILDVKKLNDNFKTIDTELFKKKGNLLFATLTAMNAVSGDYVGQRAVITAVPNDQYRWDGSAWKLWNRLQVGISYSGGVLLDFSASETTIGRVSEGVCTLTINAKVNGTNSLQANGGQGVVIQPDSDVKPVKTTRFTAIMYGGSWSSTVQTWFEVDATTGGILNRVVGTTPNTTNGILGTVSYPIA